MELRFDTLLRPVPLLLAGALAACTSYPERTAGALRDFQRGHLEASLAAYRDVEEVGSEFLSGAESGTVAFAAGDWSRARQHLHRASSAAGDLESRALVGPERLGEGLASWIVNDRSQAYQGEGFERVYVHALLGLAYLAEGLLDDTYVEARLSNQLLEAEEELYEHEYRAGGLGHFVSALAYELLGERDQAYIDYRRMVDKGVGTRLAGRALVRLAGEMRRTDDLAHWEESFGRDDPLRGADSASIVVIAGVGLGPYKRENRLIVPTGDGVLAIAVPCYEARNQSVTALRLHHMGSGTAVRTDLLESVSDVAHQNLEDRLAWTTAKSIARGLMKRELSRQLEDHWGGWGFAAGNLYAILSERADLRCWQTLPDSWQACRLFVPPGVHTLELEAIGGARRALGTFELDAGETMIVLARSVGNNLYVHPIGGRLLGAENAHPAASAAEGPQS